VLCDPVIALVLCDDERVTYMPRFRFVATASVTRCAGIVRATGLAFAGGADTRTVKLHVAERPAASVTLYVTSESPSGKALPAKQKLCVYVWMYACVCGALYSLRACSSNTRLVVCLPGREPAVISIDTPGHVIPITHI
jgi:hypothetical protein